MSENQCSSHGVFFYKCDSFLCDTGIYTNLMFGANTNVALFCNAKLALTPSLELQKMFRDKMVMLQDRRTERQTSDLFML